MVAEQVANRAGYSRRTLHRYFGNKEELVLELVEWIGKSWYDDVGYLFADESDPVATLLAVARGTAVYCRHDVPRVLTRLRIEFKGIDDPVGQAVNDILDRNIAGGAKLIAAGRRNGTIPLGAPPRELALAYLAAMNGVLNAVGGQAPFDAQLTERALAGVLGLAPSASAGSS
jgi:AcrR family transcriptional regulator